MQEAVRVGVDPTVVTFSVLGGLRAQGAGGELDLGGPKQRTVLAALLVRLGRPLSATQLIDLVWGDDPPASPEGSLQAYVSNLRRALEPTRRPREQPGVLVTQAAGYALAVPRDAVDACRLEDRAAEGHDLLRRGDVPGAIAALDAALAEWTGPMLPELAGVEWVDEAAASLARWRAQALEDRFDAGLAAGEAAALVPRIERAIAEDPYREHWRAQLALALYRSGRQRDALQALQDARTVLGGEVGVEPGPELRALEADILAQSPTLDRTPSSVQEDVVHTFVFTDIEGSTALWERDHTAMADALAMHDRVVESACIDQGGTVFSRAGDSYAAAFGHPAAALAAAARIQAELGAASWPTSEPIRVRIGVHAGPAQQRDGDYLGPTVNEAARVMGAGHGGQVLLTEEVRRACADVEVVDLGPVEVRGVGRPLHVHQLVLEGGPESFPPLRTEAAAGPASSARPFVGRAVELASLLDAHRRTHTEHGRPVVVSGEPGIGKTRLVEELLAQVPADTVVAWGRCPEQATQAAYLPCIQIARQLDGAGALDPELIGALLPDEDVLVEDAAAGRLALHVAVSGLLAATTRPLVLVLDDLQWADPASLRLIEFIAADLARTQVLLVVTVRPLTSDAPRELVECLGELARSPGAVRVDLVGLGVDDVGAWVAHRSAGAADPRVAPLVLDRTGGNPFFVGELVELLAGDDRLVDADAADRAGVPAAVHDVVRRRVNRLPADTQQLLAVASVVGRIFDVDVIGDVVGGTGLDVLDQLDPALEAGLITEGELPGRFRFAHALVTDTLLAELSASRRARLHAATAGALARLRAADLDNHLSELAHHAFEGAAAGTAEQAYEWSVRAASHAARRLAHDDAARHWARAVRALELARPADLTARLDALLELGRCHMRVDAVHAALDALMLAMGLAIELGDHDRIEQAAIAMTVEGMWMAGENTAVAFEVASILERAIEALPSTPTPGRVMALANATENAYWLWPIERLDAVSAEAVAVAREIGEPEIIARALHKRLQAMWRPATRAQSELTGRELAELADTADLPPELEANSLFGAAGVAWEGGDVAATRRLVARAAAAADRSGNPALITQLQFFAVSLRVIEGRLDEAARLLGRAYELYRRTRRWAAESFRAGFACVIHMENDRVDLLRGDRDLMLAEPYGVWFREGYAFGVAELGELDEAAELVRGEPPQLVESWLYLGLLAAAAHSRAEIGDLATCEVIVPQLLPYAGRLATTGTGVAFGDTDLALARLAQALGDDDSARRHAARSVELQTRVGDGPWLVRALLLQAALTGDEAPRARAAAIVEQQDLALLRRKL